MKNKRQQEILEIIKQKIVLTQEDLQNELLLLGYNVTQSTVSRDIKELKLIKSHDSAGNYRYISNENVASHTHSHYRDMFLKAVKSIDYALNNVVIHCYSGSAEMVREFTDGLGMYIAFGGTITFKNAIRPREAAKAVPLDKLLIEPDSPYLSPVPHRGERNSSINLSYVVKMLSEIKGIPESEIEAITYENGKKLFNI